MHGRFLFGGGLGGTQGVFLFLEHQKNLKKSREIHMFFENVKINQQKIGEK